MSVTHSLLVAVVLLLLFLLSRVVYPAKDQRGTDFRDGELYQQEPESLRVATFNIQTGKSLQGARDIRRAAELLKSVDLAAVQEVYGAGWLNKLGFGEAQTASLASPGNFSHLFAATRFRWGREQRGNTTLSKLPVSGWRVLMLPDQSDKSPRNMTVVNFTWRGKDAVFINTHLHTGRGREQQLEAVLEEFMRYPRAILAGDFNTRAEDPILANALTDPSIIDAVKVAGLREAGEARIDWILTRGFEVIGGTDQPKGISDHPYYEVILR